MGLFSAIGDAISSNRSYIKSKRLQDRQYVRDKEFAQHSIEWKTKDAKRAGIHPLYALGSAPMSPNAINTSFNDISASSMGQSLDNFIDKKSESKYNEAVKAKNLENIQADIDLKRAQATGYIAEAKRASDAHLMKQTGRKNGNENQIKPSHILVENPVSKKKMWVPNPDVYESGEIPGTIEFAHGVTMPVPGAKKKSKKSFNHGQGRWKKRKLRTYEIKRRYYR